MQPKAKAHCPCIQANEGHDNHQSEKAIDHRRDSRQELNARLQERRDLRRSEPREEDRGQKARRNAEDERTRRYIDGSR